MQMALSRSANYFWARQNRKIGSLPLSFVAQIKSRAIKSKTPCLFFLLRIFLHSTSPCHSPNADTDAVFFGMVVTNLPIATGMGTLRMMNRCYA
jgi:hypothetical protein